MKIIIGIVIGVLMVLGWAAYKCFFDNGEHN